MSELDTVRIRNAVAYQDPDAESRAVMTWLKRGGDKSNARGKLIVTGDELVWVVKDSDVAIKFVYVPSGWFIMGSDTGHADESPRHSRYLPGYFIEKLPTRHADYATFAVATGRAVPEHRVEARGAVVNISWFDAEAFKNWAGLRFLSEAEWEKAARGTEGLIYPWGNTWEPDVSKRAASPFGLLEMCGTVWQWVRDTYRADAYSRAEPSQGENPFASSVAAATDTGSDGRDTAPSENVIQATPMSVRAEPSQGEIPFASSEVRHSRRAVQHFGVVSTPFTQISMSAHEELYYE